MLFKISIVCLLLGIYEVLAIPLDGVKGEKIIIISFEK